MGFRPRTKREQLALAQAIAFVIAVIITIIYFLSPIDIIPDAIPLTGWTDDVGVGIISLIISSIFSRALVQEHFE